MVYGVFGGCYSDWYVVGYFNNRLDADKYCAAYGAGEYYVEEMKDLQDEKDLSKITLKYDHEIVFARQIQAHGRKGDIFIAISTSGNSCNIIKSIQEAKKQGLKVIGLTGNNTSEMDKICDLIIKIPSNKTPFIQESHIMIGHIICALVEESLS